MSMQLRCNWLLGLCFLITAGQSLAHEQQTDKSEEFIVNINQAYTAFSRMLEEGKPEALANEFYTSDAKFFPPGGGVVEGRAAIGKMLNSMVEAGVVVEPQAIEVEDYGEHIYEYGIATTYNQEGQALAKERYIAIWKLDDGQWRIHRDFVKGRKIPN
ncbi:YybH family protein [Alteromonas halophila]|uniref:DUF4440 domain-containing protein n=1 Tax=Alteromonas halophila TaxID=516698 RepID=A0A918JFI3_9ALTE|nr:nuclear transport factor 2 family protein [Alteromonas halophila]GGW73064.1 hypothetical protein GCM10007391_00750 [Alteromonas halophila]